MAKITFETKAWISQYNHITPDKVGTEDGAASLYYARADLSQQGYAFAGNATITLDVPGPKELVENKVAAMREEIKATRAEASARVTKLEGQIQQLLAIEFKPSKPA